ncbi:MAG: phosphatidate cytidylyltransferase [Pseudomonadales bacterium]
MLKERIITALLLLLFVGGAVLLLPEFGFTVLAIAVFSIAAWEWAQLAGFKDAAQRCGYVVVHGLLAVGLLWLSGMPDNPDPNVLQIVFTVAGVWWAIALLWVQSYPGSSNLWQHWAIRSLMGLLVLLPALLAFVYMRILGPYIWLVLYLVALVAAADVGAYFAGKAWGVKKMAPRVSPGKSWAGLVGGMSAAMVLAVVVFSTLAVPLGATQWLIISLIVSLSSVLGDLLESMLKRHCGIKDSGQILPGHGGVLDRMDGWTAAAPIFALCLLSVGWPQ